MSEKLVHRAVQESREEWFWMLVSYMKVRALAVWLRHYPETSYQSFELLWPTLFDRMLSQATAAAVRKLRAGNPTSLN